MYYYYIIYWWLLFNWFFIIGDSADMSGKETWILSVLVILYSNNSWSISNKVHTNIIFFPKSPNIFLLHLWLIEY